MGARVAFGVTVQPHVDTEFTVGDELRTRHELDALGFEPGEITQIRARVGPAMLAYNAVLWDWAHLGLFDLLGAHDARAPISGFALGPEDLAPLYWWVMEIAKRGRA